MPDTEARAVTNAMTVDVEDYFHVSAFDAVVPRADWDSMASRVVANTQRVLELFAETNVRATFFVLGWVATRFPQLVRQISDLGHEVASHGYHHQMLYHLMPDQFREDVRSSKAVLETVTGQPVRGFRAPSFSIIESSLWALDVLIEEGYQYDASVFPINHDRYGIPYAPRHCHLMERPAGDIVELPGSTVQVGRFNLPIGGGGYFRLLPYMWTYWGIRRVNEVERRPITFYFHPWEIDPDQPRFIVPRTTRLRHYGGLKQTRQRLGRLLRDFRFDSVASVLHLDREELRVNVA